MAKKSKPIHSGASPEEIADQLKVLVDFQDQGLDIMNLSSQINQFLIPHLMNYNDENFHSLYNFFPEKGALFGARLALRYNQGVTNFQVSPGGAMLEELCCQALCRLFNLAPQADATFMYCGTYANQQALNMAIQQRAANWGVDWVKNGIMGFVNPSRLKVICSSQAHLSLRHAVRTMGLGENSLIPVPVDQHYRLDIKQLKKTIEGMKTPEDIFCIVSTAGSTSTGSIDPIWPLVDICKKHKIWLHVDGAYGLAFYLLPEQRHFFKGIEQADSIIWDPHKQFGVPIPSSILFVKEKKHFERMAIYGQYFNRQDDPAPNPGLKSPPTTRPFAALPLVTSLRYQGLKKIRERLHRPLKAIRSLASILEKDEEIRVCHTPETGLLCIQFIPQGINKNDLNLLQETIFHRLNKGGRHSISITELHDGNALRLVAISPKVTLNRLLKTVSAIKDTGRQWLCEHR